MATEVIYFLQIGLVRIKSNSDSDIELIEQVKKGRSQAFDILVKRYLRLVVSFIRAHGMSNCQAEDLAQETFVKAFRALMRYEARKPFKVWLLTIARNLVIDECRKSSRNHSIFNENENELSKPTNETSNSSPDYRLLQEDAVEEILGKLPIDHRLLLEMRILLDMPFADIAEVTGETENSLKVRFHRILCKLRQNLCKGAQK